MEHKVIIKFYGVFLWFAAMGENYYKIKTALRVMFKVVSLLTQKQKLQFYLSKNTFCNNFSSRRQTTEKDFIRHEATEPIIILDSIAY